MLKLSLAAAAVMAAFAASHAAPSRAHHDAATPGQMNAERAKIMEERNKEAGAYSLSAWGEAQLQIYRACMQEHGQME